MPEDLFQHLKELESFKTPQTAIITDIDGTISEIVPQPDEAIVGSEMKETLRKIGDKFKLLAFITGRTIEKARRMVNVEGALYVGIHGMEYQKNNHIVYDPKTSRYRSQINELEDKLGKKLDLPGIIMENKRTCLTIHYRLNKNHERARETILNAIKSLKLSSELKISEGRKIVEIKPQIGNNKGAIINKIIDEFQINHLIYMGDNTTDVDAFKEIKSLDKCDSFQGISIVVLSTETPQYVMDSADYYVNQVSELVKFFNWLLYKLDLPSTER